MPGAARSALLIAMVASGAMAAAPLAAQTLSDTLSARLNQTGDKGGKKEKDRLLVDARELVYNRDANTVEARGDVQLYYQGRILEADRVIYDRTKNRVYAEGNAKLTDETGGVTYASRFDLTDDFKNGFIDSLSTISRDRTRFTAPRAERTDGETTVFDSGTYTACEPCKDDPERPPLWQVRAKRIIHKNQEQMVYYESARLEFLGVPLAWAPYLSAPDPSVKRKTGWLAPHFVSSTKLGYGVATPFFWAIAPNYDLTLTPTLLSRQGVLGDVLWRHRIDTPWITGSYNVRASGLFQADQTAFYDPPSGPGSRRWRGALESTGKMFLSDKWSFGWSGVAMTDRWYHQDYKVRTEAIGTTYFKEAISTLYLNGKGDRGFFDLRGYHFRGLSAYDWQKQQPLVGPVLDYNKTIDLPPATTGIGGQLEIDANVTHLSRQAAVYQATGLRRLDQAYSLYDVCEFGAAKTRAYSPPNCLLRGVGGDVTRATVQASWKRQFIDPIGQVWTPFAFLRADASWMSIDRSRSYLFTNGVTLSTIANADQANFFASSPDFVGRITPGFGMEWRYPFIARTGWGAHVIEPIAQIVVRPNERNARKRPNEDAQSLIFDDSNLFEWNKFSGYDRLEGGTRANLGVQYASTFSNGGSFSVMAGQSFQLAGRNSYAFGDVANVGVNSGLETRRSDYVGRIAFTPVTGYSFIAKGRFDETNWALRRLDIGASFNLSSRLQTQIYYSRYVSQPEIGFPYRREGVLATARFNINDNYYITGSALLDLDRHLADRDLNTKTSLVYPATLGLGIGYKDECTTFSLQYTNSLTDVVNGTRVRTQQVLLRLELRTLGEVRVRGGTTQITTGDSLHTAAP
ncbi:MAG: LPS-assembly protein LptD [Methylobacteriaceae bacterium]|nr:LPS-assembly protein LptD [Methylobacteriaceae bacterium]